MQAFSIIQQVGPLPISKTFNAPLDGPALLAVTASLWATQANVMMQLTVSLDGQQVGVQQLWSNAPSTHRALPTLFCNITLTAGTHTLQLTLSGSGVVSDYNDVFSAALLF